MWINYILTFAMKIDKIYVVGVALVVIGYIWIAKYYSLIPTLIFSTGLLLVIKSYEK